MYVTLVGIWNGYDSCFISSYMPGKQSTRRYEQKSLQPGKLRNVLSNLNIISRGRSLLTWMVKVWKWSESHRAKWGSQLQISSNANVAAEGPLSFCSSGAVVTAQALKTFPFIIVFNYLYDDGAGIPAAHWGPLCEPSSRGCAGQSAYFLPSGGLSAEFRFHADVCLYSLSSLAISLSSLSISSRCSLTWQHQGSAIQLRTWSSHVEAQDSCFSTRKWGCTVRGCPQSTNLLELSSECPASSLFHKGACRLRRKSRKLTGSSLNLGMRH